MLQLRNHSPFAAQLFGIPECNGIDALIIVLKATFVIGEPIELAPEQRPVVLADEHWGDPDTSSLRHASEVHVRKVGTDVVVIGDARAPRDEPVTELAVAVGVGDRRQQATVHGDRFWTEGIGGVSPSRPKPFIRVPLTYERAYGGRHVVDAESGRYRAHSENPVGLGFVGKRSVGEMLGQPVPNIDDPRRPLTGLGQSPSSIGFGPISPHWEPRARFAGTYDKAWEKTRAPYLPEDFDPRFVNIAPEALRFADNLQGGEPVALLGMHPEGLLRFALPCCRIAVEIRVAGRSISPPVLLETVVLEPTEKLFSMSFRAVVPLDKEVLAVEYVEIVGEMSA